MITPIEISRASIPSSIKAVRVSATARKQLVFKLTDEHGTPVDLRAEVPNPPAAEPLYGVQPAATGGNVTVRMRVKEGDIGGATRFDISGELLPETGFVSFIVDGTHTAVPGIYSGNIGRFAGDYLVDTWPVLILIEANAFASDSPSNNGPLTIPEVRLAIFDLDNGSGGAPFSNLLDDVEFQDLDIMHAIHRVVDIWNETPAPTTPVRYTSKTFPYRYWWTVGATAILLRMAAARYRRNSLQYQAGGVAINDQAKSQEYEQIAETRMGQFMDWMRQEKTRLNAEMCWGVGL